MTNPLAQENWSNDPRPPPGEEGVKPYLTPFVLGLKSPALLRGGAPQTPNSSPCDRANSTHSSGTGQPRHSLRPSFAPWPRLGNRSLSASSGLAQGPYKLHPRPVRSDEFAYSDRRPHPGQLCKHRFRS